MSGYYEKHWQEALAGASIQPSESLWENIEENLNDKGSNRIWLTILLIAATITIAFAFPLTIGDSSFEARPDNYSPIAQTSSEVNKSGGEVKIPDVTTTTKLHEPVTTLAQTMKPNPVNMASADLPKNITDKNDIIINEIPDTKRIGLASLTIGVLAQDNLLDDYYLIPFYMPTNPATGNKLLATINMGRGNSSAGNGFNGFASFANADMASATEFIDQDPDARTENSGSTYYLGAGVELPLGKKWSFFAGLGYLAQTATGTSNIVFNNNGIYQPIGAYDPIIPGTVILGESYNYSVTNSYINVPMTLKYPLINRKFKFRVGLGISTDFMIGHTVNSASYGKVNYDPAAMQFTPVVFAGLINMDVSYPVNNQYAIAFETGLRKGINAIDKSKTYYPSSFTMGLVLFYKIR